ncbi:MAG: T9SS type A sorting domain-containing protein, partial [Bacteroidota bacterium]|nr:T9SS type A sorting domain-containing protein [Bacteroidota bacterium]
SRYNTNGSLDNDFGNDGVVLFDGGTDSDAAWDMLIQDDGKILISGSVNNQFTTVDDFAMVRFNTDGTPDNTFGTGGLVITDIDGQWDNAYALAIQDDGKILLAGEAYSGTKRNMCVVRYESNGSMDLTFGSGGIVLNSIGCVKDRTRAMTLQADGKILVAGFMVDGLDEQAFLTRINTDGSIDNSFGNAGVATLDVGGNDDRYWALSVRPDGKIIAAGYNGTASNWDYMLVRYLIDGTLDNTFGSNGIALSNFGINDMVQDMVLQPDGKILIAGGGFVFELIRFMENGYPDTDFGDNGIVNTTIGTGFSFCQALAQQSDGKIVLAGHTRNPTEYDFALCRYHSEEGGYIIDQNNVFNSISIYPNPVAENNVSVKYQIVSGQEISIDLLASDGKIAVSLVSNQSRTAGPHTEELLLPGDLPAGLYFVRIISQKGSAVMKLEVN